MMRVKDCLLPELGENIDTATVVEVFIAVGDRVVVEQPVCSLETDKAEFELPSSVEGCVSELMIKPGDELRVGQLLFRVQAGAGDAVTPSPALAGTKRGQKGGGAGAAPEPELENAATFAAADSETVGNVATTPSPSRREGKGQPASSSPVALTEDIEPARQAELAPTEAGDRPTVAAAPSVRRLARELGVDIGAVEGTRAAGRVTVRDVRAYVRQRLQRTAAKAGQHRSATAGSLDPDKEGVVERVAMSKVRRRTAEQMARSWAEIPHVTHYDKADITELDRLRNQFAPRVEAAGGKLTMTAILLKVVGSALGRYPKFNASVDMAASVIVYKKRIHVGVAVDTERGLLVPVIRDVDEKNIMELALALGEAAERARGHNIRPDMLEGAGFTITNLGGIGGTAFSPLINPPEVAVLGVARACLEPVWSGQAFEPRLLLPLSVTYDHRVIDGADAARFLRWLCEALAEPFLIELEGD